MADANTNESDRMYKEALMRRIVITVMMVLLWAVPCPAADSGFKEGAREVGKGIKEAAKESRTRKGRRKPVKRSRKTPSRSPKR